MLTKKRRTDKLDYQEYLQTEHWHTMRRLALEAANHRCQVCYSDEQCDVHHRTYERLWAERLSDLCVLCRKHHQMFHEGESAEAGPQTPVLSRVAEVLKVREAILSMLQDAPCPGRMVLDFIPEKTGTSERAVQRVLRGLVAGGVVERRTERREGRPMVFIYAIAELNPAHGQ